MTTTVPCNRCHKDVEMNPTTQIIRQIQVVGLGDVQQAGLLCPHCQAFYHAFYTNFKLRKLAAHAHQKEILLAPGRLLRDYQQKFDRFQVRVRKQLARQRPHAGAPDNS